MTTTSVHYPAAGNREISAPNGPSMTRLTLLLAVWSALVGGLVEGVGLLVFQRINWENWGRMTHVSIQIIWASAIVDLALFLLLALCLIGTAPLVPQEHRERLCFGCFSFFLVYDWVCVPHRLRHSAELLLALGAAIALARWMHKHRALVVNCCRRTLPWAAAAVLLLFLLARGLQWHRVQSLAGIPPAKGPNIIVVVIDTLRADHLSAYGYPRQTSPNIDALAREGVLFQNAISTSSWTVPSHASILTGRYPSEHGAVNVRSMSFRHLWPKKTLDDKYPTIAEVLSRRGYRTAAFSANRLYFCSQLGFDRGFVRFDDYFHSSADMFFRTLYGRKIGNLLRRRRVKKLLYWAHLIRLLDVQVAAHDGATKRAAHINEEALRWIDRRHDRPFFAFLNYFDVHVPYRPPLSFPRKFGTPDPVGDFDADDYDDSILYVDEYIGQLVSALKARNLASDLLLVVTSDHGEALGEHGVLYAHHSALYREQIHVPFILWQPGRIPPGLRVDVPVSNASIAATLLDLCCHSFRAFPGPSLSLLWTSPGEHLDWPYPVAEVAQGKYVKSTFPTYYGSMTSIVTRKWHYVFHDKFGAELYNWENDPCELTNVARNSPDQSVVRSFGSAVGYLLSHPTRIPPTMSVSSAPAKSSTLARSDVCSPLVMATTAKQQQPSSSR